jgi:hypothetical protein
VNNVDKTEGGKKVKNEKKEKGIQIKRKEMV